MKKTGQKITIPVVNDQKSKTVEMVQVIKVPKKIKKAISEVKVLPTDQIQKLANTFKLSWREIYKLDAEF
jgi:hypothetical protein